MVNTLKINDYKDIKELTIDKTKPTKNRLEQYITDVKNPYKVRVGDILVKIEFVGKKSLLDALGTAFSM